MAFRKKIIVVPVGNVQKMAKANGVTPAAVYNALNYNSNSDLAQLLRKQAIEAYGGVNDTKIVFD